jgi:Mitochondrial ribosomal protein (VAR1)
MNPNIIKIIGMQKPYIFKGAASCMQNKRVFHSKVALRMENLIPKIFIKKRNIENAKIIPLNTPNSQGYFRHFPAAITEWSSSIYAHYNNNHIKSLPILDKNLVKLIKSYFNFYHESEKLKSERILLRFRRVSLKKIFISKAELKHTNSKVIINIHLYNLQKRLLMKEFIWVEKFVKIERFFLDEVKNLREVTNIREYYMNLMRLYTYFKFNIYIPKLKKVISKIYKKKVEFNFVILKHMYLNSDILSQAIALKLKDRDNRV